MSRLLLICALLLAAFAMPATASAQKGDGPYSISPSVPERYTGDRWYRSLDVRLSPAQLRSGTFTGALPAGAAPAATSRAGIDVGDPGVGNLLAAGALVLLAVGAGVAVTRRGAMAPA